MLAMMRYSPSRYFQNSPSVEPAAAKWEEAVPPVEYEDAIVRHVATLTRYEPCLGLGRFDFTGAFFPPWSSV